MARKSFLQQSGDGCVGGLPGANAGMVQMAKGN
jgi:hypothetical protein